MFTCPTSLDLVEKRRRESWEFYAHLMSRMGRMTYDVLEREFIDDEKQIITFNLHDFSGNYTGYQKYNWRSDKKKRNAVEGRYFAHTTPYRTAVFGLQYHEIMKPELFVCEGIFDAITLIEAGYNAIAILSNNSVRIRNTLELSPVPVIAVCDGDSQGAKLAKICDRAIYLPEGEDPNSMGAKHLKDYLEAVLGEQK